MHKHLRYRRAKVVVILAISGRLEASCWVLRNDLGAAERLYHPKYGIVVVGHSRMQAVETGRILWDEVFEQNADALYAKIPDDNLIKQTLVFHSDPDVKRIVFICVPYRGGGPAFGLVGMLCNGLIMVYL